MFHAQMPCTLMVGLLFSLAGVAGGQTCQYGEPPSDFCTSARVIPGSPGHHVLYMDVTNATSSGEVLCGFPAGHTVWFDVTPTVSGPMTISTCHPNTLYDTVVAVYRGGDAQCEFMQSEGCNDDTVAPECDNGCSYWGSSVTVNATAGMRYRFVVGSVNANQAGCPTCLGVIVTIGQTCGEPPRNFICSEAEELPGFAGIYEVAVDARDMPSEPADYSCAAYVGSNLWYRFVSSVHGLATFSTCHPNTAYDTVARALVGDCLGFLAESACEDDHSGDDACTNACGTYRGSKITFPITQGVEYFLEVGAYNDNSAGCDRCLGGTLNIVDCDAASAPVAELDAPADFGCLCNGGAIIGTASDPGDLFSRYELEYRAAGSATWSPLVTGSNPVVNGVLGTWSAAAALDGWYFVRLTTWNECGLSASATSLIRLGKSFDTVRLDAPASGAILGGSVCFDGTAWDQSCFDYYTVDYRPAAGGGFNSVDPAHPQYDTTRVNEPLASWATASGVPDGGYQVRLRGWDTCGNMDEDLATVTIDNTPPIAVITAPYECDYVEGTVTVRGTAADANLVGWTLMYTGGQANGWIPINSDVTPVSDGVLGAWNTTGLEPCAYVLRLVVTDRAAVNCNGVIHNQTEYTIGVNVGYCGDFDADDDNDVDLIDFRAFQADFTGPLPGDE